MQEKNIKKARALKYDKNKDRAPKLIAKGDGFIAQKIIDLAHENGIMIREDAALCELLSKLETGDEIPTELYKAVAEVFSFIYQTSKKFNKE